MTTNGKCDVTAILPGTAKTAGPIAAMPTLAVIIVTDTEGGKELLILLIRTYYLNAKDIIYKQLRGDSRRNYFILCFYGRVSRGYSLVVGVDYWQAGGIVADRLLFLPVCR